ncbi:MAG: DASS family sodium-coupled anion symporter [Sphingomonadaceae bacterium]|nr:DASS family sodium-coupled anion symporter [Sphingomonadaceae bacterium]
MDIRRFGLILGATGFAATLILSPPATMPDQAWTVAGLVFLMAAWWMSEAIPLTATALLPFLILPFAEVLTAKETATAYYSPILFLILGGAFIAIAIERTGLHRRLALVILDRVGANGSASRLLLAFMITAAVLSMAISNTSSALIMMPMALAVLAGCGLDSDDRKGLAGALPIGIAFAASIGGVGTIVGSPTNAIAVGLLDTILGVQISFAQWSAFGLPVVILGIPLAAFIISKFQHLSSHAVDVSAAREAVANKDAWSTPEKRLIPLVLVTFALWMFRPLITPYLPEGSLTDGTIAIAAGLALFLLPDGTGRPMLVWKEADNAPWGVIMMFGGGLALAAGMGASGLATWLGNSLLPLAAVPLPLIALAIVAMVIIVTEFASNVATASAIIPVVASLIIALGVDPLMLAMPAAIAASWGFMLPAGTGPNAIAWSTGRIQLSRMIGAGLVLDIVGGFMIVALVWAVAALF